MREGDRIVTTKDIDSFFGWIARGTRGVIAMTYMDGSVGAVMDNSVAVLYLNNDEFYVVTPLHELAEVADE